jgi:hypothetical protein
LRSTGLETHALISMGFIPHVVFMPAHGRQEDAHVAQILLWVDFRDAMQGGESGSGVVKTVLYGLYIYRKREVVNYSPAN